MEQDVDLTKDFSVAEKELKAKLQAEIDVVVEMCDTIRKEWLPEGFTIGYCFLDNDRISRKLRIKVSHSGTGTVMDSLSPFNNRGQPLDGHTVAVCCYSITRAWERGVDVGKQQALSNLVSAAENILKVKLCRN